MNRVIKRLKCTVIAVSRCFAFNDRCLSFVFRLPNLVNLYVWVMAGFKDHALTLNTGTPQLLVILVLKFEQVYFTTC